jgi:WD40 repeat protein
MVELDELELELGPEVIELASSLSIAAMVDPALLRITRRTLHPKLTQEAEAVVFHSPLAESQGRHGFVLNERHLPELRWRLVEEGRLDDARGVLEAVHAGSPTLVRLEEQLIYELLADRHPDEVGRILDRVVAWLRDATDRRPVGRWILRAFRRAPEELWNNPRFATQAFSLIQAASNLLGGVALGHRIAAREAAPVLPVLDDRTMPVGARLGPVGLVLSGRPDSPSTIQVPAAWPVVLDLQGAGGDAGTITLHDPASVVATPVSLPVTVRTITGRRFRLGQEASRAVDLPTRVDALAWSADPARVVAASRRSRQILRLSTETLEPIETLTVAGSPPEQLVLARTGMRAAASVGSSVTVWDLPDSEPSFRFDSRNRVHGLAFSGDGEALAAASSRGTNVWRLRGGGDIRIRTENGPLALSPDGDTLAVAGYGRVEIWNLTRGGQRSSSFVSPQQTSRLAWSMDGRTMAVGDQSGEVRLVDGASLALIGNLRAHQAAVEVLAFAPDRDLLASGDRAGVIHIWDLAEQERPAQTWTGHDGEIRALAWSPDGARVASAGTEGSVRSWDVLGPATPTPRGPAPASAAPMRLTVLPAAHGTSLVLELGSVERPFRMVVDGGPASSYRQGLRAWADSLPAGRRRIDVLAITHTDDGSIGGVLELLQDGSLDLEIGDLWCNGLRQLPGSEPL